MSREFDLSGGLRVTPAIVFGMNQGYVSDGHDGANHIELRLGGKYPLTTSISLVVHLSYSFGIDRDAKRYSGDELLQDFSHAGIGLGCEF